MWDLTSLMEPAAPALEDEVLTTGPPGKSPETSFSKAGREAGGLSMNHNPFYTGMPWGTCHLQQCPTYSASLFLKAGLQTGRRRQKTALDSPQRREDNGSPRDSSRLPPPAQSFPGAPGPTPALALERITQQFLRSPGTCTPHHHSPFPTKLCSQIFHFIVMT